MFTWDDMTYWQSGEWQVIQQNLDDLDKKGRLYCPVRHKMFDALDATPFDKVKVVLLGQDPYPDRDLATGLAFSVPKTAKIPPTLNNMFNEYVTDLGYPRPTNGDLTKWAERGVLLWNIIPSCEAGKSLSHDKWREYDFLSKEMFEHLSKEGVVFVTLGDRARSRALQWINLEGNAHLHWAHPSPRNYIMGRNILNPFIGSRMYSTINAKLVEIGEEPIDWKL